MLRDRMPLEEGAASVIIYKFSDFLSLTIFLGLGLAISWLSLSFPPIWYWGGGIVLGGMIGVACLFLGLKTKGIYGPIVERIRKLFGFESQSRFLSKAQETDQMVQRFFMNRPGEFKPSLLFNFLGWFGGVLKAYICLRLLGLPASWQSALAIETFALFLNNVTFFIPARLGVVEGSRTLIFMALGFPAASGMAYGIVRRVRELIWIAFGYGILSGLLAEGQGTSRACHRGTSL